MNIFELTLKDKENYLKLYDSVVATLEHPEWLTHINQKERKTIFTNNDIYMFACEMDNRLVGASGFFLDYSGIENIVEFVKLKNVKIAEIGASIVIPQYRGKNIMLNINKFAVQKAKEIGLEYLIASVHPDNLPSNNSLRALGMEFKGTTFRNGKLLRNIYLLKI